MSDKGSLNAFINPYPRRPWMAQTGACAPAGQTKGLKGTETCDLNKLDCFNYDHFSSKQVLLLAVLPEALKSVSHILRSM